MVGESTALIRFHGPVGDIHAAKLLHDIMREERGARIRNHTHDCTEESSVKVGDLECGETMTDARPTLTCCGFVIDLADQGHVRSRLCFVR